MTSEYRHIPVLLNECLEHLDLHEGDIFVDATLGFAGHSAEAAKRLGSTGALIGIDQDVQAREAAAARLDELPPDARPETCILEGNFGDLDSLLLQAQIPGIDAILFDLGVSSLQLDSADRGFSYKENAPLDMRMNPSKQTITAQEIINNYNEADLARVIRDNSDEKWASRIAKFIVKKRIIEPITTSDQLVEAIKEAVPAAARRKGGHPAKRTFQAIRIEVNDELGALRRGLDAAVRWLNPGGRLCVISYHSLEDRIVKETIAGFEDRCTCPPDLPVCVCNRPPILVNMLRKPVLPTEAEVARNPRSRSAKLRVAKKVNDG